MPTGQRTVLPAGYDPQDPERAAGRRRYDQGERTETARNEKAYYAAWRRQNPTSTTAADMPATQPPRPLQTPSLGSHRRLQALVWLGFDLDTLTRETHIDRSAILRLLDQPPTEIPATLATAITREYRRLITQPPDRSQPRVTRARDIARLLGWAGPGRWNDIDTDTAPTRAIVEDTTPAIPTDDGGDTTTALAAAEATIAQLQGQLDAAHTDARATAAEQDRVTAQLRADLETANTAIATRDEQHAETTTRLAEVTAIGQSLVTALKTATEEKAQLEQLRDTLTAQITQLETAAAARPTTSLPTEGQVRIVQRPDGGSEILFTSSRPAQIRFAGLELNVMDVAATTGAS